MNSWHSIQQPPFSGWSSLMWGFNAFRDSTSTEQIGQIIAALISILASWAFIWAGKDVSCLNIVIQTVHSGNGPALDLFDKEFFFFLIFLFTKEFIGSAACRRPSILSVLRGNRSLYDQWYGSAAHLRPSMTIITDHCSKGLYNPMKFATFFMQHASECTILMKPASECIIGATY